MVCRKEVRERWRVILEGEEELVLLFDEFTPLFAEEMERVVDKLEIVIGKQ